MQSEAKFKQSILPTWTLRERWELGIVSETDVVFLYNCVIFLIFARVGLAVFIRVTVILTIYLKNLLLLVRRCLSV